MVIDIKFFATLKDRAGREFLTFELSEGATVADLVGGLSAENQPLAEALPSALVAVNSEYAFEADALHDGDEVAFFPPVSGGAKAQETAMIDSKADDETGKASETDYPEYFSITNDVLDHDAIADFVTLPTTGAVAIFSGKVRGKTSQDDSVLETSFLFYEAYPEMAEAKLRQVADEIRQQWPGVEGIALVQRIGKLEVGQTTILVACSSGHRNDGVFEAARYGIDRVKEIVPVWKKEVGPDGETWVEGDYRPTPEDAPNRKAAQPADSGNAVNTGTVEKVPSEAEGMRFVCHSCNESYPLDTTLWRCECGDAFELDNTLPFNGELVETDTFSMWRYRAMLLPDDYAHVSLGEGWTPLLPASINGRDVYLKMESLNPTGSFKDRGSAVNVSVLSALGIESVHDDSSGNAGASLAAYAARAGIKAQIYAPKYASKVKLAQIKLYGAELVTPEGARSDVAEASKEAAQNGSYYASHIYNPLTLLGMKTLAYEIWEQLGSRNPDVVVLPVGYGSQLLGLAAGFGDLLRAGAIDRLPRLVAVQAANCAPLWAAFNDSGQTVKEGQTLAEGIRIVKPVRQAAMVDAIRESGGSVITVEEHEIQEGMQLLAELGVLAEPTSAVIVPALTHIGHMLLPDTTVVLPVTGSGFKAPQVETIAQEILQSA